MIFKVYLHTAGEDNYFKWFVIWDEYKGNVLYVTETL